MFLVNTIYLMIIVFLKLYSDVDDYFGIGVSEGRLKVVISLGWWSAVELISDTEVNDEKIHHVIIHR